MKIVLARFLMAELRMALTKGAAAASPPAFAALSSSSLSCASVAAGISGKLALADTPLPAEGEDADSLGIVLSVSQKSLSVQTAGTTLTPLRRLRISSIARMLLGSTRATVS